MNAPSPQINSRRNDRRGIALVTVLAVLSLAAVLILSFFSIAQNELTSSNNYSQGLEAQQLSQTAINLVMHQIRSATTGKDVGWASQPGAIRAYPAAGSGPGIVYKLYSDDAMKEGETQLVNDVGDLKNWDNDSFRGIYVDLNEPVVRPYVSGIRKHFPIVDPIAGEEGGGDADQPVEGFEFDERLVGRGITGEGLPMPVKWIYQLADGTLGTLNNSREFQSLTSSSSVPDKQNPIVGRVAFWTDDESAKININTAAGGRSWDTPRAGGLTDHNYGRNQPVQREFQRYPAHPAQTSLQPVLFPSNRQQFQLGYNKEVMEEIYKITPRVVGGGSLSGTKAVLAKDLRPLDIDRDRLFATVDELLFRAPNKNGEGDDKGGMVLPRPENDRRFFQIDPQRLEKVRFFLTANSRAPETTMFNTPRISIWPSYFEDEGEDIDQHSAFDRRIRFCAELAGKVYHFQRQNSSSHTNDYVNISRNQDLFKYLQTMTSQNIPGVGGNFKTKYGDDTDQILTGIFDYIRSVNLFDDSLMDENKIKKNGRTPWNTNPADHVAFTNYRVDLRDGEYSHPAHGQVAPIHINDNTGFGRAYSFMEVGIAFICTADAAAHVNTGNELNGGRIGGQRRRMHLFPGDGEWTREAPVDIVSRPPEPITAESKPALMAHYRTRIQDDLTWAYSNICPLPLGITAESVRINLDAEEPEHLVHINGAPVPMATRVALAARYGVADLDPVELARILFGANWNYTLNPNQPLTGSQRRVQPMLLFQMFCPGAGWTEINPDFRMEADISGGWSLDGNSLGLTGSDRVLRTSGVTTRHLWGSRPYGGVLEPRALLMGAAEHKNNPGGAWIPRWADPAELGPPLLRDDPSRKVMERLSTAGTDVSRDPSTKEGESNYPYVGVPVTVDDGDTMQFNGGQLEVRIVLDDGAKSDPEVPEEPMQTLILDMASAEIPVPVLASGMRGRYRNEEYNEQDLPIEFTEMQPYEMWTFHRDGAFKSSGWLGGEEVRPRQAGRFMQIINNDIQLRGGLIHWDVANGRAGRALYTQTAAEDTAVMDVTRSYVIPHGDHRLTHVKRLLDDNHFEPHPSYHDKTVPIASNFAHGVAPYGYGRRGNKEKLVPGSNYSETRQPHLPDSYEEEYNKWGDFDNTIANELDGPFINKPDEGNSRGVTKMNFNPGGWGAVDREHIPYFNEPWVQEPAGPGYFSPNRIMPSPVMFGSLPTGVKSGNPWQTLLFRPQEKSGGADGHPGMEDPRDHYFLDFFWMPVVEPWSISDPLATAGKINLNYQIVPFTYIRRDTGMRAVFASEEMLTVPNSMGNSYNTGRGYGAGYNHKYDTGGFLRNKSLRSVVNNEETLKQWDEKFDEGEIFRSASELCEMHLVPTPIRGIRLLGTDEPKLESMSKMFDANTAEALGIVGDNSRERPYANIYPRVTTKSNTFQVHFRAQIVKQSPMSPFDPSQRRSSQEYATFEPDFDQAVSEYRGSTIIERYVDPNDQRIPDYAVDMMGSANLDEYYRFRVVSNRRFAP